MSNPLGMSDEEFMNQSPEMEQTFEEEHASTGSEDGATDRGTELHEDGELNNESDHVDESVNESQDEADTEGEVQDEQEEVSEEEADTDEQEEGAELPESTDDLKRILEPFKANGSELQVKNADEAIQLMQLGANYTKKMQALQPNLKLLKTLEKNGLLEADKVNHLIDLSKKDPKAIAQLMKDAEIDPLELEQDVEYTPNDHQVSDQAMQLEQVLSSIESTPTYGKCMDVVGNQWDTASQEALTATPQLIADINEQMSMGIFDKINAEVQRARTFGGLSGMSDFEAYRAVGAQLLGQGLITPQKQQPVATSKPKPQDNARSLKRKAASSPKQTRKTTKQDYNPLAMSDDEFLKLNNIHI